ncbi:metallophosphoesterase [Brevibacillus sp. H7]|jgi:predicted MPP superfamily phosphohydrolase|uniref:metallophosphoesterase n=1 Tax=Brevibacillus sp. H7 TaxID=3349138 RepID=UPI003812C80E
MWLLCLLLVAIVFLRAYRNTFDLSTKTVSVAIRPSERVQDTEKWLPLRILHLSDLHMENLSVPAERIVEDHFGQPIDLIAITGDLLDRHRNIPKAVSYVETVMQLKPVLGTFVVFGNHDYVLRPNKLAQLKSELERIGCHVLVNQSMTLVHNGQTLHVIGVDDYATRRSNLAKAFKGVAAEGVRLVLTHDPNVVLHMKDYEYDYLLSGHFHGGQIHWPKPYHLVKMGKLPRMNMVKGLHFYDNRPFYISEGLGQTGLNIRLRSRPEITVHTLAPASALQHSSASELNSFPQSEAAPTLAIE